MILMIDNYDSFTYNIVQYFGELKQDITVWRNDQVSIEQIKTLAPDVIVIGPGPCDPDRVAPAMASWGHPLAAAAAPSRHTCLPLPPRA